MESHDYDLHQANRYFGEDDRRTEKQDSLIEIK